MTALQVKRLFARTWLATVLFASVLALVIDKVLGQPATAVVTGASVLTVPVLWWRLVGHSPRPAMVRGVLAGTAIGAGIPLALMAGGFLLFFASHPSARHADGFAAPGNAMAVAFGLFCAVLGAAAGAITGALVLGVQRLRAKNT